MGPGSEPREHRDQRYVRNVRPETDTQRAFIEALDSYHMVLALGPASTGKTYLSIAKAVEALEAGDVQRIVLTRPAMEAGESIGYLPGSLHEKMAPYLRPMFDALSDRLGGKKLGKLLA
ncbi:MAG: PhoH family protein, partial [Pseudomonadota bacterium]|nr:PhoH family protein [Pseudomonadota bacterium]